jgi:hypothetical protein
LRQWPLDAIGLRHGHKNLYLAMPVRTAPGGEGIEERLEAQIVWDDGRLPTQSRDKDTFKITAIVFPLRKAVKRASADVDEKGPTTKVDSMFDKFKGAE